MAGAPVLLRLVLLAHGVVGGGGTRLALRQPSAHRHLVLWRGRSRHTYGFEREFDLPRLELEALLQREGKGIGSEDENGRGRSAALQIEPVPPSEGALDSTMCWVDVRTPEALNDLVGAASRAVLTHAVFAVLACGATIAAAAAAARDAGFIESEVSVLEVIDLNEPNLRAGARQTMLLEFAKGFGDSAHSSPVCSSFVGNDVGVQKPNGSHAREWVLIKGAGASAHYVGWRVASGAAAGRGAPSRAIRRPGGGLLRRFALKRRKHNAATAIEPELGFLLANLARVSTGDDVLDPCCGGCGLLICPAALGARTFGVDRNSSVLQSACEDFKALGLAEPTLDCDDVMQPGGPLLGPNAECSPLGGGYDVVLCDPPYGMRAPVLREGIGTTWQQTMPSDISAALLKLAARVLRPGGRLVIFLPARGVEAEMSLDEFLTRRGALMEGNEVDLINQSDFLREGASVRTHHSEVSRGEFRANAVDYAHITGNPDEHESSQVGPEDACCSSSSRSTPFLSSIGLRLVLGRKQRFHTRKSRRAGSSSKPLTGAGTGAFARWLCVFEREQNVHVAHTLSFTNHAHPKNGRPVCEEEQLVPPPVFAAENIYETAPVLRHSSESDTSIRVKSFESFGSTGSEINIGLADGPQSLQANVHAAIIRASTDAQGACAALASLGESADIYAYTSAIAACGRCGDWLSAVSLFSKLKSTGMEVDAPALNAALGACARAARGEEAHELLVQAQRSGMRLDVGCFTTTARALLAEGDAPTAAAISLEARKMGGRGFGDVRVAIAACKAAGLNHKVAQLAAQALARDKRIRTATAQSSYAAGAEVTLAQPSGGREQVLSAEQRLYLWYAWRGERLERLDSALAKIATETLARPAAGRNGGDAPRADPMRASLSRAASVGRRPSFESDAERAGYTLAHLPTRVAKVMDTLALENPPWLRPAVIHALGRRNRAGPIGSSPKSAKLPMNGAPSIGLHPAVAAGESASYDAVSLGCGPGFDLAAFALLQPLLALPSKAVRPHGAAENGPGKGTGVRMLALDYEARWEPEFRAVESAVRVTLGRRHRADFDRCDITQPIEAPINAAIARALSGGTLLYTASYVVAENAAALRESNFVFFEELFERAPVGSICLILETTHRQFPAVARAAWRGGGKEVAVACLRVRSNRGYSLCLYKRNVSTASQDQEASLRLCTANGGVNLLGGRGDEFGPESMELARLFRRFEKDDRLQRSESISALAPAD